MEGAGRGSEGWRGAEVPGEGGAAGSEAARGGARQARDCSGPIWLPQIDRRPAGR